jgi:hypothetical protein
MRRPFKFPRRPLKARPLTEDADRVRVFEANKIWLEHHLNDAVDGEKYVIDFALLTLRTLSIANGGAIVALMTFAGHFPELIRSQTPLWWSFILFGGGLSFTLASMLYAYLSQGIGHVVVARMSHRTYFDVIASGQLGAKDAFVASLKKASTQVERDEDRERVLAGILATHAVVSGVAAFCAFVGGAGTAIGAVLSTVP